MFVIHQQQELTLQQTILFCGMQQTDISTFAVVQHSPCVEVEVVVVVACSVVQHVVLSEAVEQHTTLPFSSLP